MLRAIVTALLLAVIVASDLSAQTRAPRIGVIAHSSSVDKSAGFLNAFRERLREFGYVEGRNIAIDVRFPSDHPDAYRDAARELVALKVDVIVTANTGATRAAHQQTATVPIVMASVGNAVLAGFVKTLSQPGGNVTGQSFMGAELQLKGVDLLIEALPRVQQIAMMYDPELVARDPPDFRIISEAAKAKGVAIVPVRFRRADDLSSALRIVNDKRPSALHVLAVNVVEQLRIAEFAAKHGMPALCLVPEAADTGALMSYGPNLYDSWRVAATYVDKILKGAMPADLPVEQPTRFELVINLKTAKALGVTLPPSMLTRADRLIE